MIIILNTKSSQWNSVHVEYKSRSDNSNSGGNSNHVRIIQTISEQHTVKSWNLGITKKKKKKKPAILGTAHIVQEVLT
jgi:hypothetical protein